MARSGVATDRVGKGGPRRRTQPTTRGATVSKGEEFAPRTDERRIVRADHNVRAQQRVGASLTPRSGSQRGRRRYGRDRIQRCSPERRRRGTPPREPPSKPPDTRPRVRCRFCESSTYALARPCLRDDQRTTFFKLLCVPWLHGRAGYASGLATVSDAERRRNGCRYLDTRALARRSG